MRPGHRVTLRIAGIPAFLSHADFEQVFRALEGCVSTRLNREQQGTVGYAEFNDLLNAQKCKSLYSGWQGWGAPGLQVELITNHTATPPTQPSPAHVGNGQTYNSYDSEAYSKQQQQQGSNLGYGLSQQQQQQQPGEARQAAPPGLSTNPAPTAAAAPAVRPTTMASGGLAAALAGLNQGQLSSLAGLLGQAVTSTGASTTTQPAVTAPAYQQQQQQPAQSTQPPPGLGAATQPQHTHTQAPDTSANQPKPASVQPAPTSTATTTTQAPTSLATALSQLIQQSSAGNPAAQALQQYMAHNVAAPQTTQQPQAQPATQQAPGQAPAQPQSNLLLSMLLNAQPALQQAQQQQQQSGQQQQPLQPQMLLAPLLQQLTQAAAANTAQQQQQTQQALPAQQATAPPQNVGYNPPAAAPAVAAPLPQYHGMPAQQPVHSAAPVAQPSQPHQPPHEPAPTEYLPPLPANASHTLFFDNLPLDLKKREAAHIFRPIQGYKDMRIVVKEHPHRPGERSTKLFVDFVDAHAATVAMNLLQGYKLDLEDDNSAVLKPMYGKPMPAKAVAAAERAAARVADSHQVAHGPPPMEYPPAGYGTVKFGAQPPTTDYRPPPTAPHPSHPAHPAHPTHPTHPAHPAHPSTGYPHPSTAGGRGGGPHGPMVGRGDFAGRRPDRGDHDRRDRGKERRDDANGRPRQRSRWA